MTKNKEDNIKAMKKKIIKEAVKKVPDNWKAIPGMLGMLRGIISIVIEQTLVEQRKWKYEKWLEGDIDISEKEIKNIVLMLEPLTKISDTYPTNEKLRETAIRLIIQNNRTIQEALDSLEDGE